MLSAILSYIDRVLRRRDVAIKILVAMDDDYRSYQEVIAATLRILYPHEEIVTTQLETLARKVALHSPQMVISSSPKIATTHNVAAWVELSLNPCQPTKVIVGQHQSQLFNPTLENLLTVVQELKEFDQPS